ncbi:putative prolyl 4-hydroxylase 3 [Vitis vinifera]|uniref:Putative prolyl 4-hydroxylase 3 n=1 Tax=Vitis vinifera TaxID=29760 RepID=A0A438ETH9_VITVI|nr:putative prolyl 4-hydroxylase 3 [Vitis vinifera]
MAKGRYSRGHGKRWSTLALVLSLLLMLTVVLLMLLALGIVSLPIGTVDSDAANDLSSFRRKTFDGGEGLGKRGEQWTEIVSWEPRAFIYHNFLVTASIHVLFFFPFATISMHEAGKSIILYLICGPCSCDCDIGLYKELCSPLNCCPLVGSEVLGTELEDNVAQMQGGGFRLLLSKEECEYMISLAKPYMKKSTVVDSETGRSKDSRVRTSSGMFLRRGRDKIIRDIEKRIADFTFIPVEHGEGLQVLHYEVGQKSDVEEGGETVFPATKANFSSVPWWNELSECGKKGLSVKPKMGDALLFWSMRPDATLDPSSLHGGCPVIKGNKWSSTKWMHVEEYKA